MSRRAWAYVWWILSLGIGFTLLAWVNVDLTTMQIPALVCLTLLATFAQWFKVQGSTVELYHPTLAFLFAGLLLLQPAGFTVLVILPYVIEWIKERVAGSKHLSKWYLQPVNISTHIIAGTMAGAVFALAGPNRLHFTLDIIPFAIAAVLIYLILNHLIIGIAISLARRISIQESQVLTVGNLLPDLALLFLGLVIAVLWTVNPWLVLPALSPLALMYQALEIPRLRQQARFDDKTGLLNARYFADLFNAELQRAKRFDRPLAVIMADLDLLRNVNNTYGHLAGDMVLATIGKIIRSIVREYDIAGRFGGEEFVIALPETDLAVAQDIAERIRQTIESTGIQVQASAIPIYVTMSLGIAIFPHDALTATDLIHQADLAVYQAKLRGRNRIVRASDVPHSAKLEGLTQESRLAFPSQSVHAQETQTIPTFPVKPPVPMNQLPITSSRVYGYLFVMAVILAGSGIVLVGSMNQSIPNGFTALLLVGLGILAELFQVRLYGDSTISVSAAISFATALILGIPGVALVSLGIVLTHLARNRRIPLYKTAFNWATHVLAASVPAIAVRTLGLTLAVDNLGMLVVMTALTAAIYYLVESGLITTAISLFESRAILVTWRHEFRWMLVYYQAMGFMGLFMAIIYQDSHISLLGVLSFVLPMGILYYAQKQYVEHTKDSMSELQRMNQELIIANRQIVAANQAIHQLNDELFLALAKVIDARDPFVSGHAHQVAEYAVAIAKEMHLPPERINHVRQAALLHDIGKMGIPEKVLHKPAKLSEDEYEYVKQHATLGAEFLETAQSLRHLAPFIRHHHEWWNGKGYPSGLAREQIPLEARILAVCDAVEAMASDRAYHRALSLEQIVAELKKWAGIQFDPAVVEAFVRVTQRQGTSLVINSARQVVEKHSGTDSAATQARLLHYQSWNPQTGLTFL